MFWRSTALVATSIGAFQLLAGNTLPPLAASTGPALPHFDELRSEIAAPDASVAHARRYLTPERTGLDAGATRRLARLVASESRRHALDPALVLAVIRIESSGRPEARSHKGAIGLMQLLPPTARAQAHRSRIEWFGEATLLDPETNVRLGIAYLAALEDRFGDLHAVLAAYNAGPTRIAGQLRRNDVLPVAYRNKVLSAYGSPNRT